MFSLLLSGNERRKAEEINSIFCKYSLLCACIIFLVLCAGINFSLASQELKPENADEHTELNQAKKNKPTGKELSPFGSNLFQGNFVQNNPAQNRIVSVNDKLVLRLWGDRTFDGVLDVLPAGDIVIPEVGSVPVLGLNQSELAVAISSKLNVLGIKDTQVYVSFLDNNGASVLVTGFVLRPGRYTGSVFDTILAFLDQAGGIEPKKGSYRDIKVLRNGAEVIRFDLYPFILKGVLPEFKIQDGDTIVVSEKGITVNVSGEVRNLAKFEFTDKEVTGQKLIDLADPSNTVTDVSLNGTRKGVPYNLYISLADFKKLLLADDDKVEFLADQPSDTIMIEVQGAIKGASRFPLKRNARLKELQRYISIDPNRANLSGLYIKRKSVAVHQKKAIEDALRRLEESYYTATSGSTEEMQIRKEEAEMISKFAQKARTVEPEGIVVVGTEGKVSDIGLEDGDIIVIPEKSDVVLINGEVLLPQAIVWSKDKSIKDYIKGAGGYNNRADKDNILLIKPNAEVFKVADADIESGDQVLILPKFDSKNMQMVKDVTQVIYQMAVATKFALGMGFF